MSMVRSRCALRQAAALASLFGLMGILGCGCGISLPPEKLANGRVFGPAENGDQPNTENYSPIVDNPFLSARDHPLATFSTAVDTAAYSNVRRFLNTGQLPPKDAVRIADLLNYFEYAYPEPRGDDAAAIGLEMAPCPWNESHHLLKIAVKARTLSAEQMPPRNLVFLIDTSGSMADPLRLPLVKQSLELLLPQLGERDRVSIVSYAGESSLRLPPTPGNQTQKIRRAIDGLVASGSTNGGGGIVMAYEQAMKMFIPGGVNRVILATDGDFNVGVSSDAELTRLIEEKRKTGVFLTVLGYGMGNLKDNKLELLAHYGNGHYAYVDSLDEARKVFVEQGGALAIVAKDVKLQVEFNQTRVNAYRLIGYENRIMRAEEFRDDAADAGEMGSGHTCTALFEIVPVGVEIDMPKAGTLKYQQTGADTPAARTGEWLTVRMRYKHPESERGVEVASTVPAEGLTRRPSEDFRFAAAVAAFGMLLRDSTYAGDATFDRVQNWASSALGHDSFSHRAEFLTLVEKGKGLKGR